MCEGMNQITCSRQNPVEDNETLGFTAGREFLDQAGK
jgi:hypothetical protein